MPEKAYVHQQDQEEKITCLKNKIAMKEIRKSKFTKNEYMRQMLLFCQRNQSKLLSVLADNRFSSSVNMKFIRHGLDKHFIFALKSNRAVALNPEDRKAGNYARVGSLDYPEKQFLKGWIKNVDFPVLIHQQIFTNKDGSQGVPYLTCSNLSVLSHRSKRFIKNGRARRFSTKR